MTPQRITGGLRPAGRILALTAALLLSGCMRAAIDVELKKDGTAQLRAVTAIEAEYAGSAASDTTEMKHYTFDGTDYVGTEETTSYSDFSQLSEALTAMTEEGIGFFDTADIRQKKGLFTNTYIFDVTTRCMADELSESDRYTNYGSELSDLFTFTLSVKMPGRTGKVTGGTYDGEKTEFIFDLTRENHFYARSTELRLSNIMIAAAVLMGCAAFVLVSRNRKNSAAPTADKYAGAYSGISVREEKVSEETVIPARGGDENDS